jgi:hypothetical protein
MSADDARTLRGLIDWLGQLAAPVKEGAVGEAVLAADELAASSIPATPMDADLAVCKAKPQHTHTRGQHCLLTELLTDRWGNRPAQLVDS